MTYDYHSNNSAEYSCNNEWTSIVTTDGFEAISFNPENFLYVNPEVLKIVKRNLRESVVRYDFTDHYLYFCSTIHYLKSVDKKYKNQDFVPINYKTMVSVISKYKFTDIVSNLKEWGIIETNDSYSNDHYSKGYRLLPPYDSDIKRIHLKDPMINNKINRFKMSSFKELKKLPYPYQFLSMTNTWIEMDKRRASYYNTSTYQYNNVDIYNSNFYSISAYTDGDYRFTVDTTGNRVHTNLTNLKSDFRRFLSVAGEPLGQVDIRNSQPLFFYMYIKDNVEIPHEEKSKYKEIIESGKFYEFFMERLNIPYEARNRVKHTILAQIFFDRVRDKAGRFLEVLNLEFPTMASYINDLRRKDHRTLSHLLQKMESHFVIEIVVYEFIKTYGSKNEFISTIHDSIVVKESMLDEAEDLMKYCFAMEGINPTLSTNRF